VAFWLTTCLVLYRLEPAQFHTDWKCPRCVFPPRWSAREVNKKLDEVYRAKDTHLSTRIATTGSTTLLLYFWVCLCVSAVVASYNFRLFRPSRRSEYRTSALCKIARNRAYSHHFKSCNYVLNHVLCGSFNITLWHVQEAVSYVLVGV
jgi:hypothetical protein